MNGKTLTRLAATAAAVGIGTTAAFGTANAAPAQSPVDAAIAQLTHQAGKNPAAQTGVREVARTAQLIDASHLGLIAGGFAPFAYQAPTFGCGDSGITLTAASGLTGMAAADHSIADGAGAVRFEATPAVAGFPLSSGLSVAWLNVANGRSGITPLDGKTEFQTPNLSKTVETGPGTVIASLWGTVNYPGSMCVVTPTVGLFTVTEAPAAVPPAPGQKAPAQQPGAQAPGAPKAPAPGAPAAQPHN